MEPPNIDGARESYALKHQRALELGFTEAQAPFIATAAYSRPGWSVGRLRRHVEAQFPWLWENPAQGRLFDEGAA